MVSRLNNVFMADIVRSAWNSFWFFIRNFLKWSRSGYSEATTVTPVFHPEAEKVNSRYRFSDMGRRLSPANWHRNLATLWYFEKMLSEIDFSSEVQVLEPGCQNFSRLPAIDHYMTYRNWKGAVVGLELDAYVPVQKLYSLYDHAQYYRSLIARKTLFTAADFFKSQERADLIVCFYPFVSKAPALAWGIPAIYASADKWIDSFLNNLKPQGYVLVVHQGDWEQKDFDEARAHRSLKLLKREELVCPFFKTKYPAHFSLYQKI